MPFVTAATLPADHPLRTGATSGAPLVRAARCEPVPHTPVWFMRQAGRSLPEYRALREGVPMLAACFDTDMIVEITLQPVRRHGVDAGIFFSDIVVPVKAVGVDLDIKPGVGPVVAEPFRTRADLDRLPDLQHDDVAPVLAAVRELVAQMGGTPLIGFAGAPFTIASYLVEGGPSREHARTKALMYGDPELWHALLERVAAVAGAFLRMQVEAGASAVQLFDSWAGALSRADYEEYVLPHSRTALDHVADLLDDDGRPVPRIHFGVGTGELLGSMAQAGVDVVGVDFRVPLHEAARRVGPGFALQGNLDPATLFAPPDVVRTQVDRVLAAAADLPGHLFNLGHGVMPSTDPEVLTEVVAQVHAATQA